MPSRPVIKSALRLAGFSAISILLAGCLDSGGSGGGSESFPAVSGEIRFVSDSQGLSFAEAVQNAWASCDGNRYFETDLVRVYGEDSVSDQVKKDTAAAIHHYWQRVASGFGLTEDEYRNRYRHILIQAYGTPPDHDDMEPWEIHQLLAHMTSDELKTLFRAKEKVLEQDEGSLGAFITEQGITHTLNFDPVRIGVCIDPNMPSGSGTGQLWGITVGPGARGDIVHHELVHYAQSRLLGGEAFMYAPRWFTEGQATFMAGQRVAGRGDFRSINPVKIEHCYAADGTLEGSICLSGNEPYNHYALSYRYLTEGTSMEAIRAFMESVHDNGDGIEFKRFKAVFGNYFKKPDGTPLSYGEYQADYHLLLEDFFR